MKRIGNNHGRKNKSTVYGTWTLDGVMLILNENKTKNNDQPEPMKYKVINGDLWYLSPKTSEPTRIALKRK
jgi:hypothetical protein